jgi:DNA-binding MarR family transcriptional regulator/GNAT superfamily N-acetyltransferase
MGTRSISSSAAALRHFNRFYTAQIGLLDRDLLGSGHSLSEARVLYELALGNGLTAGDLSKRLGLDPGYLSRMLAGFEKKDLVARRRSAEDGRVAHLALTEKGRAAFAELDARSQSAAESLMARLGETARGDMVAALKTVESNIGAGGQDAEIILRPHRIGDMAWIVHRQARLYHEEYGWDLGYEALILDICGRFLREFKPERETAFIAERGGEIIGGVFVVEESAEAAKLRLLYVEPSVRGNGLGRRLVDACIAFAREKGYARLNLWTNDILIEARRIYEKAGFQLVDEAPHHSFGKDLTGQGWSLDLRRTRL